MKLEPVSSGQAPLHLGPQAGAGGQESLDRKEELVLSLKALVHWVTPGLSLCLCRPQFPHQPNEYDDSSPAYLVQRGGENELAKARFNRVMLRPSVQIQDFMGWIKPVE